MQTAERRQPRDEIEDMLRQSVQAFVARNPGAPRLRALRDQRGTPASDAWASFGDAGWLGIRVPEARGGLGLGLTHICAVAEELGVGLAPEPFAANALAISVLATSDNDALADAELPALLDGSKRLALAWQEAPNVLDPADILLRAEPAKGGATMSGVKRLIPGATTADAFLVTALSDSGIGIWWVKRDQPGVRIDLQDTVDGVALGTLTLDNALVTDANRVTSSDSTRLLRDQLEQARLVTSAALFGLLQQALSITAAYCRTREQFGKPIGSFQSIQHRLVDMWMQQEVTRNVLAHSIGVFASTTDLNVRSSAASAAKAQASKAAMQISRQAIQLHGGIGYADEHDIGLFLKRAIVLSGWLGGASLHRRRYAATNSIMTGDQA